MADHSGTSRNLKISRKVDSNLVHSIPDEIIEAILSKVAAKSLLRFRCVSKPWCSLISSKSFIETHLENSIKNPDFTHHSLISDGMTAPYKLRSCSVHDLLYESDKCADDIVTPSIEYPIDILGCCNGLCYVMTGLGQYIWNPVPNKYKKLPGIEGRGRYGLSVVRPMAYGFGYDKSNDDYKVLVVWYTREPESMEFYTVNVYSLRTNSWKTIEGFQNDSHWDAPQGKFVNGKLHWGFMGIDSSRFGIASFDLEGDFKGTMEPPSNLDQPFTPELGVLDGCLCLLCNYRDTRTDVWVMKKYGVRESWTKMVSVPDSYINPMDMAYIDPRGTLRTLMPLCVTREGMILFCCCSHILFYDPETNSFTHPKISNFNRNARRHLHIQSLVSPLF